MVEERRQNKSITYRRQLTVQQKDERQDNCDRRQLARQHPNDLLRLLTCGRDRQTTARRRLDRASSFTISSDGTSTCLT